MICFVNYLNTHRQQQPKNRGQSIMMIFQNITHLTKYRERWVPKYSSILFCILLYFADYREMGSCNELYRTALNRSVLYFTVLYCTILYISVPSWLQREMGSRGVRLCSGVPGESNNAVCSIVMDINALYCSVQRCNAQNTTTLHSIAQVKLLLVLLQMHLEQDENV